LSRAQAGVFFDVVSGQVFKKKGRPEGLPLFV
jgi:hypothetical protein